MLWWASVLENIRKYFGDVIPIVLGVVGFVYELFFKKSPDASVLGVCAALVGSPLFTNRDRENTTAQPHRSQHQKWEDEAISQEEMQLAFLQEQEKELQARIAKRRRRTKRAET